MKILRLLKHDLAREVLRWEAKGLVEQAQADKILSEYGLDRAHVGDRSFGYGTLVTLAVLCVGLAVILVVGHNWEDIPRELRTAGLIAVTLAMNVGSAVLLRRERPFAAHAALFAGTILFGTSIFLIAQVYHLGEHFPDGFFWWGIGALPMALLAGSTPTMLLATFVGYVWFFSEASFNVPPYLFAVFIAAELLFALRIRPSKLVFLSAVVGALFYGEVLLSSGYGFSSLLAPRFVHFLFGCCAVLVLHTAGVIMSRSGAQSFAADYGIVLRIWAVRFAVISLLVLGTRDGWREFVQGFARSSGSVAILCVFFAIQALLLLKLANAFGPDKAAHDEPPGHVAAVPGLLFTLLLIWALAMAGGAHLPLLRPHAPGELAARLTATLALLGVGIWHVVRGVQEGTRGSYMFGILVIVVTAAVRFVSLVDGYLATAAGFFIAGMIILAAARYWRERLDVTTEAV